MCVSTVSKPGKHPRNCAGVTFPRLRGFADWVFNATSRLFHDFTEIVPVRGVFEIPSPLSAVLELTRLVNFCRPNIHDLARRRYSAVMFLHESDSFIMCLRTVGGGTTVFDKGDVVVEHEADGERVKDTHARAHARDEQTFHAAGAQQHVEIGADEGAVAMFGDDHFTCVRF